MQTVAIYARVSSDRQKEEHTILSQTAALKEWAKTQKYLVRPEWIFEDEGYTGATLNRPGLERLRDLSVEGELEAILVYAPSVESMPIKFFSLRNLHVMVWKYFSHDLPRQKHQRTNCCFSSRA